MTRAHIVAATRLPVARYRGAYQFERPDDLLTAVLQAVLAQCPTLSPQQIEEVVVGCAIPEAEQGLNIARMGVLLSDLPENVPAFTVNRFCASGLEAIAIAAQRISSGSIDVAIAAGVESMSVMPQMFGHKVLPNPRVFDSDAHLGMTWGMGATAEEVAQRWAISREDQDVFAAASHSKALAAMEGGYFKVEVSPYITHRYLPDGNVVKVVEKLVSQDEGPRPDSTLEKLARLKPVFKLNGSVTAGNASQMSDGAAALILMSEKALTRLNLSPLARFAGYSVAGVSPRVMGIGPVNAIPKALQLAGIRQDDLDWIELNEAFAAQSLAVIRSLKLNTEKVNPLGGAIALGHPLGATGAIRSATLLHGLRRTQGKWGMTTMCIGTGMGAAGIFEAV